MVDSYPSSDPGDRIPPRHPGAGDYASGRSAARDSVLHRLSVPLTIFGLLLIIIFAPGFAERMQYAITRGKQRAELEAAEKGLESISLDQLSLAFQLVSKRVAPSVVNINVIGGADTGPQDELSSLFGMPRRMKQGQGSGVIIDADGYVLTNYHVVRGATQIDVSLADGRILPAVAVGVDPLTDLALLKLSASGLEPAEWGDSGAIEVGALVWAVGSPFGLQHSITAGIVSGKNRPGVSGSVYYDFLQTDAAVNPGNSGGPLVDTHGRIIGINTAILGEAYQGISFAIPSNEARSVYERLRAAGRVARGWLGVALADIDAERTRQMGLEGEQGVLVEAVTRNSPAERAGLRSGDIILEWDSQPATNATHLSRLVARTTIGSSIDVVIWRLGRKMTLKVVVGERPADPR